MKMSLHAFSLLARTICRDLSMIPCENANTKLLTVAGWEIKNGKRGNRQREDAAFSASLVHLPNNTNMDGRKRASTFLFAERDEDREEEGVEDERKRPRDQGADDDIEDDDAGDAVLLLLSLKKFNDAV